jgi:hypothetical protein
MRAISGWSGAGCWKLANIAPVIDRVTYPETGLIADCRGAVEYLECQQSIGKSPGRF